MALNAERGVNEQLTLLEPTREYRRLEQTTRRYLSSRQDLVDGSDLTDVFIGYTGRLAEEVPTSDTIRINITPPRYKKLTDSNETEEIKDTAIDVYFPQTQEYFGIYTPDATRSQYIDRACQIGSLLQPADIANMMYHLPYPPAEQIISPPPTYELPRSSLHEAGDSNTFMTYQQINSTGFHLSFDRMVNAIDQLEEIAGQYSGSLEILSRSTWLNTREKFSRDTSSLDDVLGREMQKQTYTLLQTLDRYKKGGNPVPETLNLISEDASEELHVSIINQRIETERQKKDQNSVHTDTVTVFQREELQPEEYPRVIKGLLPHLKAVTTPQTTPLFQIPEHYR